MIDERTMERLLKAAGLKTTEVAADNAVSNNASMLSRFNEGEIIEIPEDFVCYPSKNKNFKGAAAGVTKDGRILWPSMLVKQLSEVEGTKFTGRVLKQTTQLQKDLGVNPSYQDIYDHIRGRKLKVVAIPTCKIAVWREGQVVDSQDGKLRVFAYADEQIAPEDSYALVKEDYKLYQESKAFLRNSYKEE